MADEFIVTDLMAKKMAELSIKEADIRAKLAEARSALAIADKTYSDAMEAARIANEPAVLAARTTYGEIENQCSIDLSAIEIRKREIAAEAKVK